MMRLVLLATSVCNETAKRQTNSESHTFVEGIEVDLRSILDSTCFRCARSSDFIQSVMRYVDVCLRC